MTRKDTYYVVPPAPSVGIVIVAAHLKTVPPNVWHIYDRYGVLVWEGRP
jgi:hypothetical protein